MLNQLKGEYEDRNVLLIEQNVDAPIGGRLDRWFDGHGLPGTVYLPLVMVDSGHRVSSDAEDYHEVYSDMMNESLDRAPSAYMTVEATRIGDNLRFKVQLANRSGTVLSATNDATLTALVWQEPIDPSTVPVARKTRTASITTLGDGETGSFNLEAPVTGLDPELIRWVVIADYRPDGTSSAYDTLQAVMGP